MTETAPEYTAKSPNIYQRIAAACDSIKTIVKTGQITTNRGTYTIATSSDVITPVRVGINKNGLVFICKIKSYEIQQKQNTNSYGKTYDLFWLTLNMEYTLVNIDNPEEKIVTEWPVVCSDESPEIHKLFGKALTYGQKYYFIQTFNLPRDDDDPDLGGDKGSEKEPEKDKKKAKPSNPQPALNPPPAIKEQPIPTSAPNGYHQQKVTTPTPPPETARPANNKPAVTPPSSDDHEMKERERIKNAIKEYMALKKIPVTVVQNVAKSIGINKTSNDMTSTELNSVLQGIKEGQEYMERHPDEYAPTAENKQATPSMPATVPPSPEALKKN